MTDYINIVPPQAVGDALTPENPATDLLRIERCALKGDSESSRIAVRGWYYHHTQIPVVLELGLAGREMYLAERRERQDVAGTVTALGQADHIYGFDLEIAVEGPTAAGLSDRDHLTFEIRATLSNGAAIRKSVAATPDPLPLFAEPATDEQRVEVDPAKVLARTEKEFIGQRKAMLKAFLSTGQRLQMPAASDAELSLIIYSPGDPALLQWTLSELGDLRDTRAELAVICDTSGGDAVQFARCLSGAKIISPPSGASKAAVLNQAAAESSADYLFFLDAGVAMLPGTVGRALQALKSDSGVGAVGGQLIDLTQRTYSAGGIIWQTGHCSPYARGLPYAAPETSVVRWVDYCPESMMVTARNAFRETGGFDLELGDGYIAVDYCLRLQELGFAVKYRPEVAAQYLRTRAKFAASAAASMPQKSGAESRRQLIARHGRYLQQKPLAEYADESAARLSAYVPAQLLWLHYGLAPTAAETGLLEHFAANRFAVSVIGRGELLRPLALEDISREIIYTDSAAETVNAAKRRFSEKTAIAASCRSDLRLAWTACRLSPGKLGALILDCREMERAAAAAGKADIGGSIRQMLAEADGSEIIRAIDAAIGGKDSSASVLREAGFTGDFLKAPEGGGDEQAPAALAELLQANWHRFENPQSAALPRRILPAGESSEVESTNYALFPEHVAPRLHAAQRDNRRRAGGAAPVEVIVPVYNAAASARRCLESVIANTARQFRLHLVNDGSSDPSIAELLEYFAGDTSNRFLCGVTVIHHTQPRGFPAAVNSGLPGSPGDVVILNSDVVVPPNWLERLLAPIESDESIASVTPFSNNATICSFPVIGRSNELPYGLSVEAVDDFFRCLIPPEDIELPTGVGFCMAMSRRALLAVGQFDADLFGRGYGEENDWCCRAKARGFRHVLAANLFVFHEGRSSFDAAQRLNVEALLEENLALLSQLHPCYHQLVEKYLLSDPAAKIRKRVWTAIQRQAGPERAKAYLWNAELGGGSWHYLERTLAAEAGKSRRYLLDILPEELVIQDLEAPENCSYRVVKDNGAQRQLAKVIEQLGVVSLEINHCAGMDVRSVAETLRQLPVPYSYFVHDYYSICPCAVLLCRECRKERQAIDRSPPEIFLERFQPVDPAAAQFVAEHGVDSWRSLQEEILSRAQLVIAPSRQAALIINSIFPGIFPEVRPHAPLSPLKPSFDPRFARTSPLNVAIVGAIGPQKGSAVLYALHQRIVRAGLGVRLVVIGYTDRQKTPYSSPDGKLIITGPFEQSRLSELLARYRIGAVLIPSLWHETFSYTTQEALQCGYPVICFDLGGQAEQVRQRGAGWILPEISVESVFRQLEALEGCRDDILRAAASALIEPAADDGGYTGRYYSYRPHERPGDEQIFGVSND